MSYMSSNMVTVKIYHSSTSEDDDTFEEWVCSMNKGNSSRKLRANAK